MQKLIDELKLYPGKDQIPTELADKILAVYQVNAGEVSVSVPISDIVREAETAGVTNATIYTTPTTGKFFLISCSLSASTLAGAGTGIVILYIDVIIDGSPRKLLFLQHVEDNAAPKTSNITFSFPNPILIDPNTAITLDTSGAAFGGDLSKATIVGYTQSD